MKGLEGHGSWKGVWVSTKWHIHKDVWATSRSGTYTRVYVPLHEVAHTQGCMSHFTKWHIHKDVWATSRSGTYTRVYEPLHELAHTQGCMSHFTKWHIHPFNSLMLYCRSGNISEVLIFANFARTNSRIQESHENYYYNSANNEKCEFAKI